LIKIGIVKEIIKSLQNLDENKSILKIYLKLISILCGETHNQSQNVKMELWEDLKFFLPIISELLILYNKLYDDVKIFSLICKCLNFLLPGIYNEKLFLTFISFLRYYNIKILAQIILK
jgi:hypothetical protein